MDAPEKNFLSTCLFFNTNSFSRHLLKLAEIEFKPLDISPAHASLLLLVFETPGISPKDLSRLLQLNPSTITRFIDSLVKKNLVFRENRGKAAYISPTQKSLGMRTDIAQSYKKLYLNYSRILGPDTAIILSHKIAKANDQIKKALLDHEAEF